MLSGCEGLVKCGENMSDKITAEQALLISRARSKLKGKYVLTTRSGKQYFANTQEEYDAIHDKLVAKDRKRKQEERDANK